MADCGMTAPSAPAMPNIAAVARDVRVAVLPRTPLPHCRLLIALLTLLLGKADALPLAADTWRRLHASVRSSVLFMTEILCVTENNARLEGRAQLPGAARTRSRPTWIQPYDHVPG